MSNEVILVSSVAPIFSTMIIVIFGIFIISLLGPSRARNYRKDMADMYVVGKIKKIAKEEDIDLNEEFSDFAKAMKVRRVNTEALDTTIERELQEKMSDSGVKDKK